jgi:Glycosyl transferases group 1
VTSVAAVTAEAPGSPGVQVRIVQPAAALAREGVDLVPLTLVPEEDSARYEGAGPAAKAARAARNRRRLRARLEDGFDVALVYRRADVLPSLALERAAAAGRRLVYDVDDAIWLEGRPRTGSHPLARLKGSPRKVRWLAERADRVIAGNAILAERLARFSSAVSVVPSVVDSAAIPVRVHDDGPELVLAWIGSRTTAPFLATVRPALARAAAALPGVGLRMLVVGGAAAPIPGVALESRPWSAEAQRDALARLDVGLMPLPDTEWNRGKCAYKALQYMAAGAPVVADDVGIAGSVVGGDAAGRVVRGEDEWVEALVALARDRALRARLGAEGRARVERDFSLARWAPELARLLRG